jgi:hypothetical protein
MAGLNRWAKAHPDKAEFDALIKTLPSEMLEGLRNPPRYSGPMTHGEGMGLDIAEKIKLMEGFNQEGLKEPDIDPVDLVDPSMLSAPFKWGAKAVGAKALGGIPLVAGATLFESRPWLREMIGNLAGKRWVKKYSKDLPGDLGDVAADAYQDLLMRTGKDAPNFGMEIEMRSPFAPRYIREAPGPNLEEFLPEGAGYDIVPEVMNKRPEQYYQYPGEIRRPPLEGWGEIERWLRKEGQDLYTPKSNQEFQIPIIGGGRHGGGGHLHVSGRGLSDDPEMMKSVFHEYMQAAPFITPPRPRYKSNPDRPYVPDPWGPLSRIYPDEYTNMMRATSPEEFYRWAPKKGDSGLAWRDDLQFPRPEFRQFYAPESSGEMGENMMVVQYLLDVAEGNKGLPRPDSMEDFLDDFYTYTIAPNKDKIRDIHQRWFPEGYHEAGSPYAGRGLDRQRYTLRDKQAMPEGERRALREENISGYDDISLAPIPEPEGVFLRDPDIPQNTSPDYDWRDLRHDMASEDPGLYRMLVHGVNSDSAQGLYVNPQNSAARATRSLKQNMFPRARSDWRNSDSAIYANLLNLWDMFPPARLDIARWGSHGP